MKTDHITIDTVTVTPWPEFIGADAYDVEVGVTVQGNRGPHQFVLLGQYGVREGSTQLRWQDIAGGADLYAHLIGIEIPAFDWPGGHLRDQASDDARNTLDILRVRGGFQVATEAVRPQLPLIRH